ncbi:hypothetical protein [Glycocaulis sp.]|uniref:hypothetical protein n=1 Tax=Glycocaulis sp. TaxID=1969725 RepID=UPI003D1BDBD1
MINLLPETYSAPPSARRRYIWRTTALILVVLALQTGYYVAGGDPGGASPLNLAMLAICVVFVAAASYEIVILIRALDELQQRIHILAWAIGGCLSVTLMFLWGLATVLTGLPAFEPVMSVAVAALGYYVSLFLLGRSYS